MGPDPMGSGISPGHKTCPEAVSKRTEKLCLGSPTDTLRFFKRVGSASDQKGYDYDWGYLVCVDTQRTV